MAKKKKAPVVTEKSILDEVKENKAVSVQDLLRLGRVETTGPRAPEVETETEAEPEDISPEEAVTR